MPPPRTCARLRHTSLPSPPPLRSRTAPGMCCCSSHPPTGSFCASEPQRSLRLHHCGLAQHLECAVAVHILPLEVSVLLSHNAVFASKIIWFFFVEVRVARVSR